MSPVMSKESQVPDMPEATVDTSAVTATPHVPITPLTPAVVGRRSKRTTPRVRAASADSYVCPISSKFEYKPSGHISPQRDPAYPSPPPSSVAMQTAVSLPNPLTGGLRHGHGQGLGTTLTLEELRRELELDDILSDSTFAILSSSPTTGVVISEAREVPELLRPYSLVKTSTGLHVRPKLVSRDTTPKWAEPPLVLTCVRGKFDETMPHQYYCKAIDEFGDELVQKKEGEGGWQELLKSSEGRIVVKTDPEQYTVICYLPGPCTFTAHHNGSATLQVQATVSNDHFHWKIRMPDANFDLKAEERRNGSQYRITVPRKHRKRRSRYPVPTVDTGSRTSISSSIESTDSDDSESNSEFDLDIE